MIWAWLAFQEADQRGTLVSKRVRLYRSAGRLFHGKYLVPLERPIHESEGIYLYSFSRVRAENKLVEEVFKCQK